MEAGGQAQPETLALLPVSTVPALGQVGPLRPLYLALPCLLGGSLCPSDTVLQPEELSRSSPSHVIALFKNVGSGFPPAGPTPLFIIWHLLSPLLGCLILFPL